MPTKISNDELLALHADIHNTSLITAARVKPLLDAYVGRSTAAPATKPAKAKKAAKKAAKSK